MTMKLPKATKIPHFKSMEEAAEFFDTHDVSGLGEEVQLKAKRPLRHVFQFEIDPALLDALIAHSQTAGLPIDELIRRWLTEGLEREGAPQPAAAKKPRRSA
jgi:hypothetical protein